MNTAVEKSELCICRVPDSFSFYGFRTVLHAPWRPRATPAWVPRTNTKNDTRHTVHEPGMPPGSRLCRNPYVRRFEMYKSQTRPCRYRHRSQPRHDLATAAAPPRLRCTPHSRHQHGAWVLATMMAKGKAYSTRITCAISLSAAFPPLEATRFHYATWFISAEMARAVRPAYGRRGRAWDWLAGGAFSCPVRAAKPLVRDDAACCAVEVSLATKDPSPRVRRALALRRCSSASASQSSSSRQLGHVALLRHTVAR